MDIFAILALVGGLALFLFGMDVMGKGLTKLSGGKLEQILEKLTSNRLMAVILGMGVTAVIQSSSATTVMVVGFVNAGIMKLTQAVGIIMGANVGTTITSWILSLSSLDGDSVIVQLLKPTSFSPILAMIGVILIMTAKENDKRSDVGNILIGFAVLMYGMDAMSSAVKPLANDPSFTSLLTAFSNPILGVIAGAVLTAIIQSSSASVGILQALCATGAINFGTAIPIIMGQNIGTCVTALMSSIGAGKNARRASMMHFYFNFIGTCVFLSGFYLINFFFPFTFLEDTVGATGIAIVHSLFNIGCTLCWLPFANVLVKLATITIRDTAEDEEKPAEEVSMLDERFLDTPAFAMQICRKAAVHMAIQAKEAMMLAVDLLNEYTDEKAKQVYELESSVDRYEDALGTYLVKLGNRDLSKADSHSLTVLLHTMSDFERISDHAVNVVLAAKEKAEKGLEFSPKAQEELLVFESALRDILDLTVSVYEENDIERAKTIEPLEEVIDVLNKEVKERHIRRLRKGKCTMDTGLVLQELLSNFERVSDHCSNVAVCMIQVNEDVFDTHEYIDEMTEDTNPWFRGSVEMLKEKYCLPARKSDEEKK